MNGKSLRAAAPLLLVLFGTGLFVFYLSNISLSGGTDSGRFSNPSQWD